MARWSSRVVGGMMVLAGLVLAPGCGAGLPKKADPEKARQALATALEAWMTERSVARLANESPQIYFNDQKCKDGQKLLSYTIEADHAYFGQSVRFNVSMSIQKGESAAKDRKGGYLVDISRAVVIVPD